VAGAPSMRGVLELIAQVGPSDANVLTPAKHGTGRKSWLALLHAASPRARMALVAVNAGGLPEGTFESEIFGHVKGAFTDARTDRIGRFELASATDRGTISFARGRRCQRRSCRQQATAAAWRAGRERERWHLVQKPIGFPDHVWSQLEPPDAISARIGKGAFDMAEDLALEGAFGQPAGVHGHQRHARAGRGGVQQASHDFLAGCRVRR